MASAASQRQRDAFPLPRVAFEPPTTDARISRAVRRRLERKAHWQAWANDGIGVLNRLAGHSERRRHVGKPPALSQLATDAVGSAYRALGPPPADLASPEGALYTRAPLQVRLLL